MYEANSQDFLAYGSFADLVSAVFLNAAALAQILLPDHDRLPANRTFPWVVSKERIDPLLQKALAGEPAQGVSAIFTVHFKSPGNSFRRPR
jgi:hypothetical protein